jgi:hypothetical protein
MQGIIFVIRYIYVLDEEGTEYRIISNMKSFRRCENMIWLEALELTPLELISFQLVKKFLLLD